MELTIKYMFIYIECILLINKALAIVDSYSPSLIGESYKPGQARKVHFNDQYNNDLNTNRNYNPQSYVDSNNHYYSAPSLREQPNILRQPYYSSQQQFGYEAPNSYVQSSYNSQQHLNDLNGASYGPNANKNTYAIPKGGFSKYKDDEVNKYDRFTGYFKGYGSNNVNKYYDSPKSYIAPSYTRLIGKSGLDYPERKHYNDNQNPWSFSPKSSQENEVKLLDREDGYYKKVKAPNNYNMKPSAKQYPDTYNYVASNPQKSYQTYDLRALGIGKSYGKSLPKDNYSNKMGKNKLKYYSKQQPSQSTYKRTFDKPYKAPAKGSSFSYLPYNDESKSKVSSTVVTLPNIYPTTGQRDRKSKSVSVKETVYVPSGSFFRQNLLKPSSKLGNSLYSAKSMKQDKLYPGQSQHYNRKISRSEIANKLNSGQNQYFTQKISRSQMPKYVKSSSGTKYLKQGRSYGFEINDIKSKTQKSAKETEVIGPTSRNPYATDPCKNLAEGDYVLKGTFSTLFPYANPLCSFVKCANYRAYLNPCSTGTKNYPSGKGFCSIIDLVGDCGYSMNSGHSV